MAHTFTREELYDLVWSEPMRTVAERFSISDVGLAKACKNANIPVPPRGYWTKKDAKKPVIRIPLPLRDPGDTNTVKIGQDEHWFHRRRYDENSPLPPEPVFDEPIEALRARVEKAVGKIRVASTLDLAHPTIRAMLQKDERRRESFLRTGWSFDKPVFDAPLQARRLRVLNALFLALTAQRCKGSVRGDKANEISVHIGRTALSLSLEPIAEKKPRGDDEANLRKERLRLAVIENERSSTTIVEDENHHPIEQQLRKAVIELMVLGEMRYRDRCFSNHRWQIEIRERDIEDTRKEREEAARKEKERIAALEKARINNLLEEAAALQNAMTIRNYIADVRKACASEAETRAEVEAWATWALAQADRIDPVNSRRFLKSFERLSTQTAKTI